jgi:hypothetical protein
MSAGYLRPCAGKRRHPDRESAERQRRQLARDGKSRMNGTNTYRCVQCLSWHVGHTGRKFRGKGKGKGKRS